MQAASSRRVGDIARGVVLVMVSPDPLAFMKTRGHYHPPDPGSPSAAFLVLGTHP